MAGRSVGGIEVTLDIDTARATAKLVAQMDRAGEAASDRIDRKLGDIGGARLDQALTRIRVKVERTLSGINADIDVGVDPADVRATRLRIEAGLQDIEADIEPQVDRSKLVAANAQLRRAGEQGGSDYAGGFNRGLSTRMKFILAGIVALAEPVSVALQGLASGAVQILSSAFQALGASALGVIPILGGLGGVFATLKVGTSGVGDAMGAVSEEMKLAAKEGRAFNMEAEEIVDSMRSLAPAARDFVGAFAELLPQFQDIGRLVQQRLFEGLDQTFRDLAQTTIPQLGTALATIAEELNRFARNAAESLQGIDFAGLFEGLKPVISDILVAVDSLIQMIGPFFESATPAAQELAESLALTAQSLLEMIQAGNESGALQTFLLEGVEQLQSWWDLIRNVGESLYLIFQAGATDGQGLIDSLAQIVGQFNTWLQTAEGQSAINSFFETGRQILSDMGPVLEGLVGFFDNIVSAGALDRFGELMVIIGELLPTLGSLFELVGSSGVFSLLTESIALLNDALTPLMPSLQEVADTLSGAIAQALESAAPFIETFAQAFVQLLEAVAPLAGPIANLVGTLASALTPVLSALVPLFETLAPVVGELGQALATGLARALPGISTALTTILNAVEPLIPVLGDVFVEVVGILADVLAELSPSLTVIGRILGSTLAKSIPIVAKAFLQMLTAIEPLIPVLGDALLMILEQLEPILPDLVAALLEMNFAFLTLGIALAPLIPPFIELATNLLPLLMPQIILLVEWVSFLANAFSTAAEFISNIISVISEFIASILSVVNEHLPGVVESILNFFRELPGRIGEILEEVVQFFLELPGRVLEAVVAGAGLVIEIGSNIINWIKSGIDSVWGTITDFFSNLPGAVVGFIAAGAGLVIQIGSDIIAWVKQGIDNVFNTLQDFFIELPGKIAGFVARAANTIITIGVDIIGWILDGIGNVAQTLWDWFIGLPGEIVSLVGDGAQAIIGIGKAIVNWILEGIESLGSQIAAKLKSLIPSPTDLLGGFIGGAVGSVIPGSMAGELITGPTLRRVGELGMREAIIPLDLPLARVDPEVRDMAALLRGATLPTAQGPTKIVNNYMDITTAGDPIAAAQQLINRSVAMAAI